MDQIEHGFKNDSNGIEPLPSNLPESWIVGNSEVTALSSRLMLNLKCRIDSAPGAEALVAEEAYSIYLAKWSCSSR
jgi:hypothetical protein